MSQTAHWEPIFGICFYFYPCIFRLSNVEPVYLERYKTVNEICEKNELFSGCGSCSDAFSLQQKCLDEWNAPWRWSSRFDVCLLDNKGLCAKQGSCTHFILLSLQNRATRIGRQPEVIMCTRVRVASITIRNSCML